MTILPASSGTPITRDLNAENESWVPAKPSNLTILVVDDEAPLLGFIEAALTGAGYRVHTAVNPPKAIAWLDETNWKVDLIITDVLMPEMDGLNFLRIVRQRTEDIALLLISAYLGAEDLWGEHNHVPFLPKPFGRQELVQAVENCLAQHRGSKGPF